MKLISVVTGSFNEEDNVTELYERICRVFAERLPQYAFELISSTTPPPTELSRSSRIVSRDKRVRIIVNNRNFGHIRSGYHAFLQARDAVIVGRPIPGPAGDDRRLVHKWEEGYKVVLAQKTTSQESRLFFLVRKTYYNIINRLSEIELVKNATGFGLYDRRVVEDIRRVDDPYPYFRGLICDLGYQRALVPFTQPSRTRGFSKNNFYTLWDMAMLGLTNHSKVPLRLASFAGCIVGAVSFLVAFT